MAKAAKEQPTPATDAGYLQHIPLSLLAKSPRNVRRYPPANIEALAASILANGLLQNLVVSPVLDGAGKVDHYAVEAGERRRLALKHLVKRKKLTADHPVACLVTDIEQSTAASLTENQHREEMHPADQFEAFSAYMARGHNEEDTAALFGVSVRFVRQRLKLAAVAPELIDAYRAGEMTLAQLEAFTLSNSHDKQREVWAGVAALNVEDYRRSPINLRDQLEDADAIDANAPVVRFVGLPAYKLAGGTVSQDLFADEDDGDGLYIDNPALLNQLAEKKLRIAANKYREDHPELLWVEHRLRFGAAERREYGEVQEIDRERSADEETRLRQLCAEKNTLDELDELTDEQSERLDAIEDQIYALESPFDYNAAQLPFAGAVVTVGHNGEPGAITHLIRPEDKKAAAALEIKPPKPGGQKAPPGPGVNDDANDNDNGDDNGEEPSEEVAAFDAMLATLRKVRDVMEAAEDRLHHDEFELLAEVRRVIEVAAEFEVIEV